MPKIDLAKAPVRTGTRTGTDTGVYSDIDMLFDMRRGFSRKDGTSYERS